MIGKHAKELAMHLQNNHVHKYQRRSELTSMFMILHIVPCSCGVKTARAGGVAGWLNDLTRTSTTPGRVGRILSKESLEAAASAVSVSYPASTNFLMSSPLNFAPGHLSSKTWRIALHSLSSSIRERRKKELQEKQRKSGKMKASPSACNAGKYLSPKSKHTRSDWKEMLCLLCQTPTASFAQEEQRTMGQSERWLRRCLGGPKLVAREERRGSSLCRCFLGYLRS